MYNIQRLTREGRKTLPCHLKNESAGKSSLKGSLDPDDPTGQFFYRGNKTNLIQPFVENREEEFVRFIVMKLFIIYFIILLMPLGIVMIPLFSILALVTFFSPKSQSC